MDGSTPLSPPEKEPPRAAPRRVLILAPAPTMALDVVGPMEALTQAGRLQALARGAPSDAGQYPPLYEIEVSAPLGPENEPPLVATSGLPLAPGRTLAELLADARPLDTLLVAGGQGSRLRGEEPELKSAVRTLAGRARRVASVCTGAFVLAAAGLLDGKRATTHWRWAALLQERYPAVRVDAEPIFLCDGGVWSSAGVTAGFDLTLALIEQDHGRRLALAIARELVMYLRRPSGQSQFSATLAAQTGGRGEMGDLVAWISNNLRAPLQVEALAERAGLSPRQFSRVFTRETGVSPGRMVDRLRLDAARLLLEESRKSVAEIAADCGFADAEALRRSFRRALGLPPGAYRERFQREEA